MILAMMTPAAFVFVVIPLVFVIFYLLDREGER